MFYTEHIKFAPSRAWVVLGPKRKILGLHLEKDAAEHQCTAILVGDPDADVTFTKCVVMPNFAIK